MWSLGEKGGLLIKTVLKADAKKFKIKISIGSASVFL